MSVVRIKGNNKNEVIDAAMDIFEAWKMYSDEENDILAFSGDIPHNTVTPIARRKGDAFELDIVLRNNRTSAEHPDGIFHPHKELHHIKKENIGLIEVMGLAVLPGRLKDELEVVKEALILRDADVLINAKLEKHVPWLEEMLRRYEAVEVCKAMSIIEAEVGSKFVEILECCGVYKLDEEGLAGIQRFINSINRSF